MNLKIEAILFTQFADIIYPIRNYSAICKMINNEHVKQFDLLC